VTLRRHSPRPLAAAISGLREEWVPETLLGEVQREWAGAVGDRIAAAARPVSERSGVLIVVCSEAVWAQELDLIADLVLGRLNERLSRGRITRMRCRVGA